MDPGSIVAIVAVAAVFVAAVIIVFLRGSIKTRLKLPGLDVSNEAKRQESRNEGRAEIIKSRSETGGATAVGSKGAEIRKTRVRGDLTARVDGGEKPDPKEDENL